MVSPCHASRANLARAGNGSHSTTGKFTLQNLLLLGLQTARGSGRHGRLGWRRLGPLYTNGEALSSTAKASGIASKRRRSSGWLSRIPGQRGLRPADSAQQLEGAYRNDIGGRTGASIIGDRVTFLVSNDAAAADKWRPLWAYRDQAALGIALAHTRAMLAS